MAAGAGAARRPAMTAAAVGAAGAFGGGGGGAVLSNASRYGALQRAFNDRLREWHWQRNEGTMYQIWNPPGVVFGKLRKDHHWHGRHMPPWSDWGFHSEGSALRLVLGALSGRWAVHLARQREQEQFVVADGSDARVFNAFARAMDAFGVAAEEPETGFPNLRLLHANERHVARFFEPGSLRSVHVHLPWPARDTRPRRDALVTPSFAADAAEALEVRGELQLVADDEAVLEAACGVLTESRLFAPCLAFPFHAEGLPAAYPGASLLPRDAAAARASAPGEAAAALRRPLFYSRWERTRPTQPNFRFKG